MKNFFYGSLAAVVVVAGLFVVLKTQQTPQPLPQDQLAGGIYNVNGYNSQYFRNGLYANQFFGLSVVNASSSSSTAPVLALGAGSMGQLTIGTSTPGTSLVQASTTAIGLKSLVFLQETSTTTIPGVTCNATMPTTTWVSAIVASTTNPSLNGFVANVGSVPTTNPDCLDYWVVNQ